MLVLTGATGFFGSHFLAEHLLRHPRAQVVALVRDSPTRVRARVGAALLATGRPLTARDLARVKPVRIDLADPQLGLDRRVYDTLARRTGVLCHFAGHIGLETPLDVLRETNVLGTGHILRLAAASPRPIPVFHISTAYVAGGQTAGTVAERVLEKPSGGFLTAYEESKHEAECLVADYAAAGTGRRCTIVRPSILVSDRLRRPGAPQHPLGVLGSQVAALLRLSGAAGPRGLFSPDNPVTARLTGSPTASLNLVQVEHAAQALHRITAGGTAPGTEAEVVHLVHPRNVAVPVLLDALAQHLPGLDFVLSPRVESPTPLEMLLHRFGQGAHLYTHLHRDYARHNYHRRVGRMPEPDPITPTYLRHAFSLS
ncbi:SDR family oxidoreductase [Streptomyces sp. NPDC046887]|uniref:SDR family oxidoreductase n=1 Tax=Streptomyces sp. NPDC046887 TaxID=3155472 RepID=UPI0034056FDF